MKNSLGSPTTFNIIINSIVVMMRLFSPWRETSIYQEWLAEIGRWLLDWWSNFFYYEILRIANEINSAFNENTHKATALKKALRGMRKTRDKKKGKKIGGDISIPLPFRCEETVVEWECSVAPIMTKISWGILRVNN